MERHTGRKASGILVSGMVATIHTDRCFIVSDPPGVRAKSRLISHISLHRQLLCCADCGIQTSSETSRPYIMYPAMPTAR